MGEVLAFLVSTVVLTILLGADTLLLLASGEGAGTFLWLVCLGRCRAFLPLDDVMFFLSLVVLLVVLSVGGENVGLSVGCPLPLVSQYLCCLLSASWSLWLSAVGFLLVLELLVFVHFAFE